MKKPLFVVNTDQGRFRFIEKAFTIGHEICEADGGYHFHVHLKSGRVVSGVPELPGLPSEEGVLIMDGDSDMIAVIPYEAIESIDVEQVA